MCKEDLASNEEARVPVGRRMVNMNDWGWRLRGAWKGTGSGDESTVYVMLVLP